MSVRVERSFELPATPDRVWSFIADPEKRARAISVVADFELLDGEGRTANWYLTLPIPLIDRRVTVRTEDVERVPPEFVKFVGRSRAMRVTGEHRLEPTADGTRLHNEFVVEGRVPGIERFFRRNLDKELDNLEASIREYLEVEA